MKPKIRQGYTIGRYLTLLNQENSGAEIKKEGQIDWLPRCQTTCHR